MRRITMSEEGWRLLVDLVDGFRGDEYDPEDLELGIRELMRLGLLKRTPGGPEVSKLGHQVRADGPSGSRVQSGPAELPQPGSRTAEEPPAKPPAELPADPPACPI